MSEPPALDRSQLKTPTRHGEVLLAPDAKYWASIASSNAETLSKIEARLIGRPISEWRRQTREAVFGGNDRLIIMAGHQPEFYHPGVWAKFVAVDRFAKSVDGHAVNLVTDADVPKSPRLSLPSIDEDGLVVRQISALSNRAGLAFEELPALSQEQIAQLDSEVSKSAGMYLQGSQWPRFVGGFKELGSTDFVEQFLGGMRAFNKSFDLALENKRLSQIWGGPLLLDILENASRFAAAYNSALQHYRELYRVRGSTRPMPDLLVDDDRCELPLWAFQAGEVRRRVFIRRTYETVTLLAENEPIASIVSGQNPFQAEPVPGGKINGWNIRPRALILTIWARLMLADLFIHGIGGAKYDDIGDEIIKEYYRIQPPSFACVSATLHLGLPEMQSTPEDLHRLQCLLRDMHVNPDQFVRSPATRELAGRRREAVDISRQLRETRPHDRHARRVTYREIQSLNAELLAKGDLDFESVHAQIAATRKNIDQNQIARGREYFVGLYPTDRLRTLLDALPASSDFRV